VAKVGGKCGHYNGDRISIYWRRSVNCGRSIQNMLSARPKIDESLRDARLPAYKVLWQKTKLLPKWPRSSQVTYEKLAELSGELRDWFFDEGGIYMSWPTTRAYNALQETLTTVVEKHTSGSVLDPVSIEDYDLVREKCSKLRIELTNDLMSRRRAFQPSN
jgi:hypothetical protein